MGKNMTGKDCDEWKAYIEETFMDGHSFEEVAMWYRDGHISQADLYMWAMEICAGIQEYKDNMSEEEIEEHMQEKKEFLAMFGIDAEKVKRASKIGWACRSRCSKSALKTLISMAI